MKYFSRDTKDCIEKLYRGVIIKEFPLYATFWNRFIGVKENQKTGYLRPYGLRFPPLPRTTVKDICSAYLELTYAHYTLFCNLAGAHFQLGELKRSLKITDFTKRHFRHWEHFEALYLHLGICMYQIYHLWGLIFLLQGKLNRNNAGIIKGAEGKLRDLLKRKRKTYLCLDIDKINKEIKIIRDNITHFARIAHRILPNGDYAIPHRIVKNVHWDKQLKTKEYQETTIKAKTDLNNIEKIFNKLHQIMLVEFDNYLNINGIRVKY